jgi:hypothetical protein
MVKTIFNAARKTFYSNLALTSSYFIEAKRTQKPQTTERRYTDVIPFRFPYPPHHRDLQPEELALQKGVNLGSPSLGSNENS